MSPSTLVYIPHACSHLPIVSGGSSLDTGWKKSKSYSSSFFHLTYSNTSHEELKLLELIGWLLTCQLEPKLESSVTRFDVWGRLPPVRMKISSLIWIEQCLDLPGEGKTTLGMLWLVPQANSSDVSGESSPPMRRRPCTVTLDEWNLLLCKVFTTPASQPRSGVSKSQEFM